MKKKYNFSNLVSVGPLDQRMLLNVENRVHLNILYNLLKGDSTLRIYENIFEESNLPIYDENNEKYVSEIIVHLSPCQKKYKDKLILPDDIQYSSGDTGESSSDGEKEWVSGRKCIRGRGSGTTGEALQYYGSAYAGCRCLLGPRRERHL